MKTPKRITFRQNEVILVFTLGTTSNKKIAEKNQKIVQTYSYSKGQFDEALKAKTTMKEFFAQDNKVCFDCPFSVSNGAKLSACYTHKMMQYSGFISQLRSIGKEFGSFDAIPELNAHLALAIMNMAKGRFVRFGSYGEPSLIPFTLVQGITEQANNWTGYTHQWARKPEYAAYFMASTHNIHQEKTARTMGFKSFVASPIAIPELVSCPASNEMGFKSNCAKCGLCSGTKGKGSKSVIILEH
jgi:hypothetical protein